MRFQKMWMLAVSLLLTAASPALAREWTDNKGKFSVEAELVEVKGDKVMLKKSTGKVISVPIARLSKADQEFLKSLGESGPIPPDDSPKVITNSIGIKLTLIPAGKFMMGLPDSDPDFHISYLQHRVRITKPFYLGTTEVTQGQYEQVMGTNPSHFKESGPNAPADQVSWNDTQEFCRKLSEMAEEKEAGRRYRLPTEAEWEYACRAGSEGTFCYGDDKSRLGDYAWYAENSDDMTHSVGKKKPNAWGLYDMHGNVSEWCADWDDHNGEYYANSPTDDPAGPSEGVNRVHRGGDCHAMPGDCSSAGSYRNSPRERRKNLGLRVALVRAEDSESSAVAARSGPALRAPEAIDKKPLSTSSPLDVAAAPRSGPGELQQNDVEMPIRDVVAVWDPKLQELSIALVPFKLTRKERSQLSKGEPAMFVKPFGYSPDRSKWKNWSPYGELEIRFRRTETERTLESIVDFRLALWGIEKKNQTVQAPSGFPEEFIPKVVQEFELTLSEGTGTLRLASRGEGVGGIDTKVTWDINITTSVVIK